MAVILNVCFSQSAFTAPALKADYAPSGPMCYRAEIPLMQQALPSPLAPHVLVIRVDFSDRLMAASAEETNSFFDRVQGYFVENSYGVFVPSFTVSNTVHRIGALAAYGADCGSDIACNAADLRDSAVQAENGSGQDFSSFDHLMIYHAGNGQESSGQGSDIWSVFFSDEFNVDGETFNGFTIVPETEAGNVDPLGVVCHEYGHQLGLPDLYDTTFFGGSSTVGSWDIMDYPYSSAPGGSIGGNPSHLGAWSKTFLGFVSPVVISSGAVFSLSAVEVSSSVYQLPVLTSDVGSGNEFFLLEYRNQKAASIYDKGLPGSGLLIWHVDESIASNSARLNLNDVNSPASNGLGRRGVELVEADFTERFLFSVKGEPEDAFRSASHFLTPQSDGFNRLPTGLVLYEVAGVEEAVLSFTLEMPAFSTFSTSAQIAISTVVQSPNAAFQISIPAGAFPAGSSVFAAPFSAAVFGELGSASYAASLSSTGEGFLIGAKSGLQPSFPISVSADYSAGSPSQRHVLSRYIPQTGIWVPVPTVETSAGESFHVSLDHLSLFQVMTVSAGHSPSDVAVYPNPVRPSLGPSYSKAFFTNLPAGSDLFIYTVVGALVRELRADSNGMAVWDALDDGGRKAASGVYLVLIKDGKGNRQSVKLAVER